jgi:hypothetical protein
LAGLNGLTSIGGYLWIWDNASLVSLNGINNIDAGSIIELSIVLNPVLSTCQVQSVCSYVAKPDGNVEISDNAPGCSNEEEVKAACEAVSVYNPEMDDVFSIYPNPASTQVVIESSVRPIKSHLSIINLNGQELFNQQITESKTFLDISNLTEGVYLIKITSDKAFEIRMIIKR